MLHLNAQTLPKGVDPGKPLPDAGEQLDGLTAVVQEGPVQLDILRGALLDHGVHIGQQAVHPVFPAKGVGPAPEFCRSIAQRRDKRIVLHVRGAQSLVKVIQQRHNRRHTATSLRIGQKSGPQGPLFAFHISVCRRRCSCGQTAGPPGSA